MEKIAVLNVGDNVWAVSAFIFYIVILLLIGIASTRFSSKGITEFFLGGREMNKFVVALSAVVSGRSSWLLIGATGMAFVRGVSAVWAIAGYVTVELLMFIYVAPRLRKESEKTDDITLPDFFASRFKEQATAIRVISATIILVFMISYISAQFVGGGKAFSAGFGMSPLNGIILTAVIVLIYTLMGGFMAVALTDMVQAFFMIFSLFILPIIAVADLGGFSSMIGKLGEISPELVDPFSLSAGALAGFLGIGLGSVGNPHILVRYMSIDDPDKLRFSALVATFWNVVMGWAAVYIGLAGRALFENISALPGGDSEMLFPALAHHYLHPLLFGIIIASILAAIMSTADSMLLVAASALIRDIYQKLFRPKDDLRPQQMVLYSRIIIGVIVIAAFAIGLWAEKVVFWLVLFAWGGLGASFGPALLMTLFGKRTTGRGIIAGLISGTLTIIVWKQVLFLKGMIYELVPAFIISFMMIILFSRNEGGNRR